MAGDERVIERIPGYCALCISRCGSIAVVEDGRFVALEPDPTHPTARPGALREGPRRARARLPRGPPALSAQANAPEGRSRPWLAAHQLGRSARPDLHPATAARGAARPGERRVQRGLSVHLRAGGLVSLGAALDAGVREPEPLRVGGAVRMGTGPGHELHVRRRHVDRRHHARSRERRVHHVLGVQPEPRSHQPRHRRGGGAQARRPPDRRRSTPDRARRQGRCLAPRATGHRRRARPRHRARHDRARMVRRRLHSRLDQRPAARALGHRPAPDRARRLARGERAAIHGLGYANTAPACLRLRAPSLRAGECRADALRRVRDRDAGWPGRLSTGLRSICPAVPRVSPRGGRGDHLGRARAYRARRPAALGGAPGRLLFVERRRATDELRPDRPRRLAPLCPHRKLRCQGR